MSKETLCKFKAAIKKSKYSSYQGSRERWECQSVENLEIVTENSPHPEKDTNIQVQKVTDQ
jgi:hypothetical protein